MDTSQHMTDEQRAEAFREFHANQLRAQTQSLTTIRTLLIVWFVLTFIGAVFLIAAAS